MADQQYLPKAFSAVSHRDDESNGYHSHRKVTATSPVDEGAPAELGNDGISATD
jgi:hypothetical protein